MGTYKDVYIYIYRWNGKSNGKQWNKRLSWGLRGLHMVWDLGFACICLSGKEAMNKNMDATLALGMI